MLYCLHIKQKRRGIPMKCTLMHRRVEVAQLELDDETGIIRKIESVMSAEHLPVGVPVKGGIADRHELNKWWADRSIPASRSGVREALETLNLTDTKILLIRCLDSAFQINTGFARKEQG